MYEFFRWLALILGWPMQLLLFKRRTYYEDGAKKTAKVRGAALVISNHFSVFDYMVNVFLFGFRKLYVVTSEMPYRHAFTRWGMRFFGGIMADRETMSMSFIDESVKTLNHGKLVQIFPEARITPDGKLHGFKPSYIMIALRSGAPIIPIMTDGNYGIFKRVHIIVGKEIRLSDVFPSREPTREDIEKMNTYVENKSAELIAELERRKERKDKRK